MEGLTISTDFPQRRLSKTTLLSPASAWSAVSKPFQSKPKLSSGVLSSWIQKQNDEVFAQNRRIFYVPGLSSMARSPVTAYTQPPISDKWEFKGIPVLTVNTSMPPTGSELDLRTEMDFWDIVVPDKSPKPKEAETPVIPEQPDVLFDANDDSKTGEEEIEKGEDDEADDGLKHTDEPEIITPRPLSPTAADAMTGTDCKIPESRMVFQPQTTPNPHVSQPQPGRALLSRALSCCGIRPSEADQGLEQF